MPAKTHRLYRKIHVPASVEDVFHFFCQVENLGRITPAWLHFHHLTPTPLSLSLGLQIDYVLKLSGFSVRWKTEITGWDPPHSFEDTQMRGPYKQWTHFHQFTAEGKETIMEDAVVYRCPGWIAEPLVDFWYVRRKLEAIFDYRETQVLSIFRAPRSGERAEAGPHPLQ
ncbi:MAG: SRPBCC family protein [Candidatus Aminicenantaceae bacterium]